MQKIILFLTLLFFISVKAQVFDANGDFEIEYQPTFAYGQANIGVGPSAQSDNEIGVTALKSGLNSFAITMQLPPGVTYVPGTVTETQDSAGTYTVAELDINDLSNPVFSINNGSAGTNWGVGDFVVFTFRREASCMAVDFKENGGIFKDNASVSYNNGSATDSDQTIGTYELLSPSLVVSTPIQNVNGVVGSTATRTIEDVNAGNASAFMGKHIVELGTSISNYKLYYNGVEISPVDPSTNPLVFEYDMSVAPFNAGNGNFENGNGELEE
jgi:hypothetical protein